jgi:hypothetical protein
MTKLLLAAILCVASSPSFAGELIRDATIVEVANNYSGGAEFAIRLSGGVGVCTSATWIVFPEAKASSTTSNKQAIATSLLALTTGKKVRVHNYQDDSCAGANFISISN